MSGSAYSFERTARRPVTALVVFAIWGLLAAAWIWLEAAPWIIAIFALFTLPALFDLALDPKSGLHLNDTDLAWYSGRHSAQVALAEVDHVRLDTRLDFSVRASVVLHSGRKIKLPFEATPPHQAFEDALNAAGVKTLRFHFQLFQ